MSLPSMLRQVGAGQGATAAGAGPGQPLAAGGLEALVEEEGDEEEAAAPVQDVRQPPQIPAPHHLPPRPPRPDGRASPGVAPAFGGGSSGNGSSSGGTSSPGWVWRTQLEQSAPYWEGWYSGLSDMFLALRVPKVSSRRAAQLVALCRLPSLSACVVALCHLASLSACAFGVAWPASGQLCPHLKPRASVHLQVLVLVGTDRLDRPLTIGQMQGKFQPVLLPQVRLVVGLVLTASMPQDVGEGAWLLALVRLCFQCES